MISDNSSTNLNPLLRLSHVPLKAGELEAFLLQVQSYVLVSTTYSRVHSLDNKLSRIGGDTTDD